MLATRWIGAAPTTAGSLMLSTASLSALGYENDLSFPAIRLWNDVHHVLESCREEGYPADASTNSFTAQEVMR
jgi:hypothetical protein